MDDDNIVCCCCDTDDDDVGAANGNDGNGNIATIDDAIGNGGNDVGPLLDVPTIDGGECIICAVCTAAIAAACVAIAAAVILCATSNPWTSAIPSSCR
jgi:hypothetical protein